MQNNTNAYMDQRIFTIHDLVELDFIGSIALSKLTEKYSNIKVKELDDAWDGDENIKEAMVSRNTQKSSLDSVQARQTLEFISYPLVEVYDYQPNNEQEDYFFVVKIDNSCDEYYNISEVEDILTSMPCKAVWSGSIENKPMTSFKWFDESEIDDE